MNWSLVASRGLHTMDARHENREEIPEDEYEDGAERSFEKDTIALEDMPEIVIVTGMSGAGRTEAMHVFEDLGFFCVDNLPASLIGNLLALKGMPGQPDASRRLAVVCDARNRDFFPNLKGEVEKLAPAHFCSGAVVNPFKWTEGEVMTQYFKLRKKVFAGAKFIINQVGYDARKLQELMWWMQDNSLDVPAIANIYILNYGIGRTMNAGRIPGCDVTDELLEVLAAEKDAPDKGKVLRLERAAKMVAIAKGLGYAGVHIGGLNTDAASVSYILDCADELAGCWEQLVGELSFGRQGAFYYYRKDEATGLNLREEAPRTDFHSEKAIRGNYRLSRRFHHLVFMPHKGFNSAFMGTMRSKDEKKGRLRKHGFEHISKVVLYDCMDCGDCGLYACAYTCPMMKCPKCQRNGPCGGSYDGWCEVYPHERYCIWYMAYHRANRYGELERMESFITPPIDWSLRGTSAWSNYTHRRDNAAHRTPIDIGLD